MEMEKKVRALKEAFGEDSDFAWKLLAFQIAMEMEDSSLEKQLIAEALTLHMRAVEIFNARHDPLEQFFQHKMNTIMTKPSIISAFSQPSSSPPQSQQQSQQPYHSLHIKSLKQNLHKTILYNSSQDILEAMITKGSDHRACCQGIIRSELEDQRVRIQQKIRMRRECKTKCRESTQDLTIPVEQNLTNKALFTIPQHPHPYPPRTHSNPHKAPQHATTKPYQSMIATTNFK